jgi:hypothetical protein
MADPWDITFYSHGGRKARRRAEPLITHGRHPVHLKGTMETHADSTAPCSCPRLQLSCVPALKPVQRCRESNGQLPIFHEPAHSHMLERRSPRAAPQPFSLAPSSAIFGYCLSASLSFPVNIVISAMMRSIPSHCRADANMTSHCCPSRRDK